ncbi:hypothetical protein NUU61_007654 [Penicillium alfredii]|uniref:Uncharacterized protein n=1 Tax=Penicillium alfredii TaxID=1506179 RepID=A0A9W9EQW4_9EURO|nr:uncharacterized protein NUU61_007654 [Penicillium alfredii]KAJ5086347.1 hypothetical protein NUU61_007654 [Penicillium alfredii]
MATETTSINAAAFAEAIQELPLSAVYGKVTELRNSIAHLYRSNSELRVFLTESSDPEEEKKELESYVTENEGVIASMNERIKLLRTEVENRGQPWLEVEDEREEERQKLSSDAVATNGNSSAPEAQQDSTARNEGEDGVHL